MDYQFLCVNFLGLIKLLGEFSNADYANLAKARMAQMVQMVQCQAMQRVLIAL